MSWNGSNNGSDQDPWAKPGSNKSDENRAGQGSQNESNQQRQSEQGPPDLEDMFNNLMKKMGGGNSSGQGNSPSFNYLGKLLPVALVVGGIIWGLSGFYTIKEAERGVVSRLGKLHSIVQPGLNWKPTFIDTVRAVNVERISELKTQGSMLTQDENMVKVEMTVQYRIQDPAKFLFSVVDPEDSLNQATDSALRYVIGHMTMDDILTTGRAVVRERTWKTLNEVIQPYDMGLEVLDVNFQSARPPEEVKDAFDDAIKAQEDEQRFIREAEAYAREREPIARGNAQKIIEQANAYKAQVVLDAQGEVAHFQKLIPEFRANPTIMKERLYLESMEKVMANTPKVMLDSGSANNLTVLPLEQLLKNKHTQQTDSVESHKESKSVAPIANKTNATSSINNGYIDAHSDQRNNKSSRQGRFE